MVPAATRQTIKEIVWRKADALAWADLSAADKTRVYEEWVRDDEIGLVLARYMDEGRVRVYLKDTVLKGYARERTQDAARPLRIAFGDDRLPLASRYEKPHGVRTADGRVLAWGPAAEWKTILMAVFERARQTEAGESAAVLFRSGGNYRDPELRATVEAAATGLGIESLFWVEI